MKKFAGYIIIILHMCTKNRNHTMHGSRDTECDRQNLMSLWTIFCPFTPLWTQKIQILKNLKKAPGAIIIFHKCSKYYDQMMYGSWEVVHDICNCYFSFSATFCPFTPLTTQKNKILKKWRKKKCLEISSFYICITKIMTRWCTVLEIFCTMDGPMDGWKKWHKEVGTLSKNWNDYF